MWAEGQGQSITSTSVSGFGVLLQFNCDNTGKNTQVDAWRHVTIPSEDAERSGFGILPMCPGLDLPNLTFDHPNELDAVHIAKCNLGIKRAVIAKYNGHMKCSGRLYGFSHLLGMAPPFMPVPGTSITRIQRIYSDADNTPTVWYEGICAFYGRLERLKLLGKCSRQTTL